MGWAPLLGWSYTKQRWRGKILDQAEFNHWLATLQENLPTIRDFYLQMYITSFLLVSGGEADREVTKTLRFLPWLSWHASITSILGLLRPFVSPYLYHEQTWLNLHFRVPLIIGRTNQRLGRKQEAYTLKPDGLPCQTTLLHARAARAQTFRSHKQPQELVVAKESGVMWQTCWQTIQGTILSWLGKIIWGRITYCGKTIYGLHKGFKTPVEFCPFVRSGLRHGNIWKDRNLM